MPAKKTAKQSPKAPMGLGHPNFILMVDYAKPSQAPAKKANKDKGTRTAFRTVLRIETDIEVIDDADVDRLRDLLPKFTDATSKKALVELIEQLVDAQSKGTENDKKRVKLMVKGALDA